MGQSAVHNHRLSALVLFGLALVLGLGLVTAGPVTPDQARAGVPAATSPQSLVRTPEGRRPNVVVVMMDDMRVDDLRYMPNTRRWIANRGLNFRNSFSPYPLCCPARASFLLGQYAHNHGVLYHDAPYGFGSLRDDVTVATRLQKVGYQTGMVGKYLNRYGIQRSRVTGRSSVHYVPRGWTDWMVGLDDGWGGSGGTYSYDNFTQNVNGRVRHNRGRYSSAVIADQAVGLIGKYSRRTKPFFLWVTPVAPHFGGPREADDPRTQRTAGGRAYKLKTPARPAWVRGKFDSRIKHAPGVRRSGAASERDMTDKPTDMRAWPEPRAGEKRAMLELHRQRVESVHAWDRHFGRIVAKLKRTGEYDDTILVFTSDNGYYLGEHRVRQGKIRPHEPALEVPLVVAGPGIGTGNRFQPITTLDLTATILHVAGASPLPRMDGASRLRAMVGPDRPWTTPVVIEGLLKHVRRTTGGFNRGLTVSGLRTGRYKLIRYANGQGELYDLWTDPLELSNLYYRAAHRPLRTQLLRQWHRFRYCAGAECRQPLPSSLQKGRAFLAEREARATRQTARYYG